MLNNILFVLLVITTILLLMLTVFIGSIKNKSQIHYSFLCFISSMFFWNLSVLLQLYFVNVSVLEDIYFVCVVLVSTSLLSSGLVFAKTKIIFNKKTLLFILIPLVSIILIFTNNLHHLFIKKYSLIISEIEYGSYFPVHTAYSYFCILVGLYYFVYFSIKNSGFFSKQSLMIFWGVAIPLFFDLISTFKIVDGPVYLENIAFSVTVICLAYAIFKYKFLNVVPIALQNVVDNISDGFLVLDEKLNIIDYNRAFVSLLENGNEFKRNRYFPDAVDSSMNFKINSDVILDLIEQAKLLGKTVDIESAVECDGFEKSITIEVSPIISKKNSLGTVILLKDITEHKRNIETLKEQQEILIEQERLASLGQLIGGIAHNLKTPIMSLAGGIEALRDLVVEYKESLGDKNVTVQDHEEIAAEMMAWLDKMKPYCSYMSDVISAVKGQAVQMNASSTIKFTVDELVKRVDLLMKHELKKYHCVLNVKSHIDMNTEIKGEVNNLVQVFDNIIINAMQAYEGKNGIIDLGIVRTGNNVEFTFRDYAKGIPGDISDRLFKEMVTTKGKNGTGLGLYMSYSTIKGRFGGNMFFTSAEGRGTTFYITIPCIAYTGQEVAT